VTEFAKHNLWLIPILPLAAGLLIALFGRVVKPLAHVPAWLAMAGALAIALGALASFKAPADEKADAQLTAPRYLATPPQEGGSRPDNASRFFSMYVYDQAFKHVETPEHIQTADHQENNYYTWFSAGKFTVPVGIWYDHLTAIYMTFVTGVGFLIFIYAAGYMKGDFGYWRFFSYFSLFVFFMSVLVMANNFVLLYLGWEGVGLASYLLIGYYYPRPSAVAAAKKAFITNRIGDFGLAIGIFWIWKTFGTVVYWDSNPAHLGVFNQALSNSLTASQNAALYWIPFCLMLGAFGKSAQFPLHVWLPDAMEGPTPVSALIHAATMVTAGIYLIARCMPLFNQDALNVVACVGGFTAFLAASIALCTYDLKRVWAYSTLSQLGYMFLGLGVLGTSAGVFHVFTHAWFKALLFLSAGSVMHAMGGELDMRKMSGIRKVMPITWVTMGIGCLALAGVPGLAGFFSKDEIIHHAFSTAGALGPVLGVLALAVALMTAYYTFRLFFRVFHGPLVLPATAGHHEPSPFDLPDAHGHGDAAHGNAAHGTAHGHDDHSHAAHKPNDGSPLMWLPLLVLSLGAIGAGYLGFEKTGDWFHKFLDPAVTFHAPGYDHAHVDRVSGETLMMISGAIALVGIGIAWYFHLKNRHAATIVGATFKPLVKFLENKWYIDHLYWTFITMGGWVLAQILAFVDTWVIDLGINVLGTMPSVVGQLLKPTQRGLLQRYALGMLAGVAAIIIGVIYLLNR
jgi:NADH-quinone oxidoreductase subunit L